MRRNWLEWVVTSISVIAIVGIVGFLVVESLTGGQRAADVTVAPHVERATVGAGGWYLPATVGNVGDRGATSVVVEAAGTVEGELQRSALTIDLLAAGTEVDVVFGFSARPAGEVTIRVLGFEMP